MPTRTSVWSLDGSPQPPTHTTHPLLGMSWTSWQRRTSCSRFYLTSCSALSLDHLPVLIDTVCRSSFQYPPDRPVFRRTDWANFETHVEDEIPFDPELHKGMAIDTCVENFSVAVLKALAAPTPKCRPCEDPLPPIPAGIQDGIRQKNRLRRRWQVTRDTALKAEVNRLHRSVTRRLNEWRNDQWSATLESLDPEDQSLWRMTKRVMRVPTPSPPVHPRKSLSRTLRKQKTQPTVSFNPWPILRSRQVLRWLTWRWCLISWLLPACPS